MGISGGLIIDDFDLCKLVDWVLVNQVYMVMNGLVEIDSDNFVQFELFESWEIVFGVMVWIFNIWQGVIFYNGKLLIVDDVIYLLNLYWGDSFLVVCLVVVLIIEIIKIGEYQVQIMLDLGNVDLFYVLLDYYLLVVLQGFDDWFNFIGIGFFIFEWI